jgi:hypothetical protein
MAASALRMSPGSEMKTGPGGRFKASDALIASLLEGNVPADVELRGAALLALSR